MRQLFPTFVVTNHAAMLALDLLMSAHASTTKLSFGHWVLRFLSNAGVSAVCICDLEAMRRMAS